jgi:hypothetical protein
VAIDPGRSVPIEGLALSDADAIDACYGYVSIVRCVTFCVHRDVTIERTIDGSREWQCRYERLDWLATGIGRSIRANAAVPGQPGAEAGGRRTRIVQVWRASLRGWRTSCETTGRLTSSSRRPRCAGRLKAEIAGER